MLVQAGLEHVRDLWQVVAEIHRVLKDDGLVYAETPFMQQVHEGPYDFTRFTESGHRYLSASSSSSTRVWWAGRATRSPGRSTTRAVPSSGPSKPGRR